LLLKKVLQYATTYLFHVKMCQNVKCRKLLFNNFILIYFMQKREIRLYLKNHSSKQLYLLEIIAIKKWQ